MRQDTALRKHDAALRARLKSSLSGRWSAIGTASAAGNDDAFANRKRGDATAFDEVRETVMLLLARHGILTREMLAQEPSPLSWQTLSFALRRMEYAGTIRRGYFVRALSGEQYALPEALEMLREVRTHQLTDEPLVALSAADPANPYGVLLPGCGITREAGNLIVVRGGRVVLGLTSRALVGGDTLDDETFASALSALMAFRPKLTIETIDDVPALDSDRVRMGPALLLIAQLYRVEKQARQLTAQDRLRLRQIHTRPILEKLVAGANGSAAWYEQFAQHMQLAPVDFAMSYVTRSGRVDLDRLRKLSPRFTGRFERQRG